jgi:ADP-ribose pyrophosphatase YjhB (NUDIX family)
MFGAMSMGFASCSIKRTTSGESDFAFAAGCVIKMNDKLLTVRHRFSGKLGIPAGYSEESETARCTAYRETLEETGLTVTVHELLKEFDNGFRLFRCQPSDAVNISETPAVPATGVSEISEVLWLDPLSIPHQQWRFPDQQSDLMELFKSIRPD